MLSTSDDQKPTAMEACLFPAATSCWKSILVLNSQNSKILVQKFKNKSPYSTAKNHKIYIRAQKDDGEALSTAETFRIHTQNYAINYGSNRYFNKTISLFI
ncbi:hypothetical protein CEXT_680191 [Caerostris extrusa]|uniref:Uncharacterized protein n=1 Tax=Caerostris extrusa TaxID=172846 RepID=A0AAV4UTG3_CAEEX|nr:hypothetical protein CEXT_680191 [Caerostris extrusa]